MFTNFIYEKDTEYKWISKEEREIKDKIKNKVLIESFWTKFLIFLAFLSYYKLAYSPWLNHIAIGSYRKWGANSIIREYNKIILVVLIIISVSSIIQVILKRNHYKNNNKSKLNEYGPLVFKRFIKVYFIISLAFGVYIFISNTNKSIGLNILIVSALLWTVYLVINLFINTIRRSFLSGMISDIEEKLNKSYVEDDEYISEKAKKEFRQGVDELRWLWSDEFYVLTKSVDILMDKVNEVALSEELSESRKSHTITNISHDLKTPLTSIINSIYILKNDKLTSQEEEEYIEILENKCNRLKQLIDNLNEVMVTENEEIELNIEDVDLVNVINTLINDMDGIIKEANLEIVMNIKYEGEMAALESLKSSVAFLSPDNAIIPLDKNKTVRIFENLLVNIVKYSLHNTRVYMDIIKNEDTTRAIFKNVSNHVIGVEDNELLRRFIRGDKSRSKEGAGLGLSIVKSLVKVQGGNINVVVDGPLFKVEIEFNNK